MKGGLKTMAKKPKIKPLADRVLLKRLQEEEKTAGGILLPDTAKEKPQEAEVVAVGPGKLNDDGKRVPMDVGVGNKVVISKWGGTELKYEGEEYLLVGMDDILAVVE